MQSRTYFSERERSNGLRCSECLGNTAQTRLQTTCTRTVRVRGLDSAGVRVGRTEFRVHARSRHLPGGRCLASLGPSGSPVMRAGPLHPLSRSADPHEHARAAIRGAQFAAFRGRGAAPRGMGGSRLIQLPAARAARARAPRTMGMQLALVAGPPREGRGAGPRSIVGLLATRRRGPAAPRASFGADRRTAAAVLAVEAGHRHPSRLLVGVIRERRA